MHSASPLLYVHGNHDRPVEAEGRLITAPLGGTSVDGRVVERARRLIAGLGGSSRYALRPEHPYTAG